jgi:ubiquinone/menaquinone biosynthesis C-methylase UbiE
MKKNTTAFMNQRVFENPRIVNYYRNLNDKLDNSEKFLLDSLKEKIKESKILDIGVGGGRTTPLLLNISRDYIGIDCSKSMIKASKEKFPEIDFRVGDAINLDFEDNTFKFVLFSYNGIDCLPHLDRIKALKEIFRVLEPDGLFLFSAHNRNAPIQSLYKFTIPDEEFRGISILSWPFLYLIKIWNYLKLRKGCVTNEDYEILNDSGHNYKTLTYYINPKKQVEQLLECGFVNIKCFDTNGLEIDLNEKYNCLWHYYLSSVPTAISKNKKNKTF